MSDSNARLPRAKESGRRNIAAAPRIQMITVSPQRLFIAPAQRIFLALRSALESRAQKRAISEGLLADAIPWMRIGDCALVGPVLGGPALRLATRPFLEGGTREVCFLGYTASLRSGPRAGSFVAPLSVLRDEESLRVHADSQRRLQLFPNAADVYLADVVSVDDPAASTESRRGGWVSAGASFVEMEMATLVELQLQYPFLLHSGLVVTDLFHDDGSHESRLSSPAVRQATRALSSKMVEVLCV